MFQGAILGFSNRCFWLTTPPLYLTPTHLVCYDWCSRTTTEKDPNGPRASITDFYSELAEAKDEGYMDAGTQEFIHCLVASADYDSFYSVRLPWTFPARTCAPVGLELILFCWHMGTLGLR